MVKIRVQWLSYGGMALSFSIKKYSLDWEKKVKKALAFPHTGCAIQTRGASVER